MNAVWLNGRLVPAHRAVVPVDDHGFLYGDGVYETLRVYDGRPFRLEAHLARLRRSLTAMRLRRAPKAAALARAVRETVRGNRLSEAVVRLTITRGPGPRGLDPRLCPAPTVVITATPLPRPPAALYERGVTAALLSIRRNDPRANPPAIKSTSCLNGVLGRMEASDRGAYEGLFLGADGNVAEGTVTNVFAVVKNRVRTPALDGRLLAGVTRDTAIGLARRAGYAVGEGPLSPRELMRADEVFLTSSVMEIVPVVRVLPAARGRAARIGTGRPGPVTLDLLRRYRAAARRSVLRG